MSKAEYFLRKHSPTILTIAGVGGVIVTSILSVKATPKALYLIEEAKKDKGEELTIGETVKVAWKPYIPAVISGISTIGCILGLNYVSAKNQAALVSAYMLLDNTFKDYRKKTEALYGENADTIIRNEIIKSKYHEEGVEDGRMLFFDYNSMRYFQKTMDEVLRAESEFLEIYGHRGYAFLNEYYDILGEPRVPYGYQTCWTHIESDSPYNCRELEFKYERVLIDNDVECWCISTNRPPTLDYIL